MILRRNLLS